MTLKKSRMEEKYPGCSHSWLRGSLIFYNFAPNRALYPKLRLLQSLKLRPALPLTQLFPRKAVTQALRLLLLLWSQRTV